MNYERIVVDGYRGAWSVIDTTKRKGITYGLLEHNVYGDETCYLIVKMDSNFEEGFTTKLGNPYVKYHGKVWETWDDIETALDDIL